MAKDKKKAQAAAPSKKDAKKAKAAKNAKNSSSKKGKNAAASKKAKDKKKKNGRWQRFVQYLKDVKVELQRVVWPTKKELINASLIVVGALIFFGVLIAIVDNIIIIPLDSISGLYSLGS